MEAMNTQQHLQTVREQLPVVNNCQPVERWRYTYDISSGCFTYTSIPICSIRLDETLNPKRTKTRTITHKHTITHTIIHTITHTRTPHRSGTSPSRFWPRACAFGRRRRHPCQRPSETVGGLFQHIHRGKNELVRLCLAQQRDPWGQGQNKQQTKATASR